MSLMTLADWILNFCLSKLLFRTETFHYYLRCGIIDIRKKKSDKLRNTVNAFQTYLCLSHLQSFTEDYISTSLAIRNQNQYYIF